MKKSPIKRKTPLKRFAQLTEKKKPGPKKGYKHKIKPVSEQKKEWLKKYNDQCKADGPYQKCAWSGNTYWKESLERHHPFGRHNHWIMVYVYITPFDHQWIHYNGKAATEQGWIQGPFRARPYDPNSPRPWKAGTLMNSEYLPR